MSDLADLSARPKYIQNEKHKQKERSKKQHDAVNKPVQVRIFIIRQQSASRGHRRSSSVIFGDDTKISDAPCNSAKDEEKRALLVKKKPQQQAQPTYDKQHQRGRKFHFKGPQVHLKSIGRVATWTFRMSAWEHCLINAVGCSGS
jgi:hypothetical protein